MVGLIELGMKRTEPSPSRQHVTLLWRLLASSTWPRALFGVRISAASPVLVRHSVGGPSSSKPSTSGGLTELVTAPTQVVSGERLLSRSMTKIVLLSPSSTSAER